MYLPSHRMFLTCLDQNFQVQVNNDALVTFVLKSVSGLLQSAISTPSNPKEHFSIIFEAQSQIHFPQQIYSFSNPTTGSFELFVVPIGPDRGTKNMRYEAIFN